MLLDPGTFLLLSVLGGLVAVDGTSFGQFMVSRPFVAATLAGWIVGAPLEGAAIGVVLEAFHLTVLPVGAARYPEGGPAAVAGGAAYALSDHTPSGLLLSVLAVLLLEWIGGESVRLMRHGNVRLISDNHGRLSSARGLERRHLAAIGVDFLRGMLLFCLGALLLFVTHRFIAPFWGLGEDVPRLLIAALVPGLLASAVRIVGWRAWFAAAGAIGGVTLLLLTG
jgi:mannose/fructose/N-acetylgalactosamine-specific phosphotransferase system component IIC